MFRISRFGIRICFLLAAALACGADSNDIARAIRDLGAADFKTREAATKFLNTAGKDAVPALEAATRSSDPEIKMRAGQILPVARLGLPANAPAEMRAALTNYPTANLEEKQAIIERLAAAGKDARPVLISLAAAEPEVEMRGAIFAPVVLPLVQQIQRGLQEEAPGDAAVRAWLDDLEFCHAIFPEDPQLALLVIRRLDALGRKTQADALFERAYGYLDQACTKDPRNPEPHNNAAWLCAVSRRRLDDGLKHIAAGLAVTPEDAPMLDTNAELLFQKGQPARAIELIEKCIKLDPSTDYFQKQRERFRKGDPAVPPPEPE